MAEYNIVNDFANSSKLMPLFDRPQPISSTDQVNTAMNNGMVQENQRYAQQKAAQVQQAMDSTARRLNQGLLDNKIAWQLGKTMYDNAPDDASKAQAVAVMDNAALNSNMLRNAADNAGISTEGFGADVTLQQATQNMQNDTMLGLQNIFNRDMSSDEYYEQEYQKLLANGAGTDRASRIAAERAGAYQVQRMSRLRNAFDNYGKTDRGSINADGVRILDLMMQEDGNTANLYGNMYANPKMDYTTDVGRENMAIQQQAAMQQLLQKEQAAREALLQRLQFEAQKAAVQHAQKMQEIERKADLDDRNNYNRAGYKSLFGSGSKGQNGNGEHTGGFMNSGYDKDTYGKWAELHTLYNTLEKALDKVTPEDDNGTGDLLEEINEKLRKLEPYLYDDDAKDLWELGGKLNEIRQWKSGYGSKKPSGMWQKPE